MDKVTRHKSTVKVCVTCSEIIVQGYTDAIDDTQEHQSRCNFIDKQLLPAGYSWSENIERLEREQFKKCEGCNTVADDIYTCVAYRSIL